MGLAASQARFLQLTARKSNIEYQGQQINQQRLALANSSAGLFEKMLTMEVPTPPSSQDDQYYKQGYTFTDSADNLQKKVSWSSDEVELSDIQSAFGIDSTDIANGITATAVTVTRNATSAEISAGLDIDIDGDGVKDGVIQSTITTGTIAAAASGNGAAMDELTSALGTKTSDEEKALGYKDVIRNVKIEHNVYDPDGNYTTVNREAPAVLQFDNLNRLTNVTLLDGTTLNENGTTSADQSINVSDTGEDGNPVDSVQEGKHIGAGEALTYASVFDEVTYQNDVNKYEFQKASYDYQIERINQETKQVQQQDKSLELKMKQLDTEHNAVQTEMEAVQKVIQKNIEGSFKTFA